MRHPSPNRLPPGLLRASVSPVFAPLATALLLSVSLVSCSPQAEPPETENPNPPETSTPATTGAAGDAYALSVDERLEGLERRTAVWEFGDVTADLVVWSEPESATGEPVLIEESLERPDGGDSVKRYYFRDGELAYYHEETRISDFSPAGRNPVRVEREEELVEIRLAFAANGDVVSARQTLDGVEETLTEFVEPAVRRHAAELLETVGADASDSV